MFIKLNHYFTCFQPNTCEIGGQCYIANEVNPGNVEQLCLPRTSDTTWTSKAGELLT